MKIRRHISCTYVSFDRSHCTRRPHNTTRNNNKSLKISTSHSMMFITASWLLIRAASLGCGSSKFRVTITLSWSLIMEASIWEIERVGSCWVPSI
ncbi:hypothetical protein Agabi119p4_1262 [Agaricus bisporus var. burnettii]|uniref:Uncharacterized protein n=1 Tax=Agaricus bisporus var. burnettii TaxID=192524 RepID=A0A8H7KM22_AGABI|nr:hypothetical protein Agabi119p4_1262 [Agaricus bisporus var. burnettii]